MPPRELRSDEELLGDWYRGEAAAFLAFHARHRGRVTAWLRSRGLSHAEADDVTQDAFLKLHANVSRYDPARPALPWFFTLVRNCWLDALRREKRRATGAARYLEEASTGQGAPDASHEGVHDRAAWEKSDVPLGEALASLPPEQRRLVEARVAEETPYADLTGRFGKSEPALRKSFERALRALRARLAPARRE